MQRGSESEVDLPPLSEHPSLEDDYWVANLLQNNVDCVRNFWLASYDVRLCGHLAISVCTEYIVKVCDLTRMMLWPCLAVCIRILALLWCPAKKVQLVAHCHPILDLI